MARPRDLEKKLSPIRGVGSSTLRRFEAAGIRTAEQVLKLDAVTLSRRTGVPVSRMVHIQAELDLTESLSLFPEISTSLVRQGIFSPSDLSSKNLREIEELLSSGRSSPVSKKDARDLKTRVGKIEKGKSLVLVSSRNRLIDLFGQKGFLLVEKSIRRLCGILAKNGIDVICLFLDTDSMGTLGLKPVSRITPGAVKKAVDLIDAKLQKTGGGKRYFLIVGGHSIIPFYSLKNPALDSDDEVLSDNPYASRLPGKEPDEWLIPDRPMGRLPCGNFADVSILIAQLEALESSGAKASRKEALGYSAKVWEDASHEVFSIVQGSDEIFLSPPMNTRKFLPAWLKGSGLNYFNLHGSKDDKFWFGQDGSEFPRALSPEVVAGGGVSGSLVVSEACYGAYESGKEPSNAICLQFLSGRVSGFVGSTTISYGSDAPPLGEADLISSKFLEQVKSGAMFGDALARAKAEMASELLMTQGYLDEDDKKTLLQFVLYGNPLGRIKL